MKYSWLMDMDSYKASHFNQYPQGMTSAFSYFEPRFGKYSHVVFFGLQYLMMEYLTQRISMDDVLEAQKFFKAHGLPFNYEGWRHIAVNCDGKLPIKIKSVPEGTVVPINNVMMTVESTDPLVPWIVSYVETILLRLWYPCTVATVSREIKKDIYYFLKETSDDPDTEIDFKLHDFGSRGVSSQESAGIGGAAHLINFKGSDTVVGIQMLRHYYGAKDLKAMPGFSIPASEHSTITSWGQEHEDLAYENMIEKYKDYPFYACVSDSYDLKTALSIWGVLKDKMGKGTLVVRPDSGDPVKNVLTCLESLGKDFGYTVNKKGYKVLNGVRVIQGDGVDQNAITSILGSMQSLSWSATNITFGMGGGLLQKLDRDTLSFAYKTSSVKVNGVDRDVFKIAPNKRSKSGKLGLAKVNGSYITVKNPDHSNELVTQFLDGRIMQVTNLDQVRKNAAIPKGMWMDKEIEVFG